MEKELILIDGSPGIGCPVISSLSGAHFVVLVTEPTVSGFHDLKRVFELVKSFKIPAGCIINKEDTYPYMTKRIENYLISEKIICLSKIPYSESFTEAMTQGKTIVEFKDNEVSGKIKNSWLKLLKII